MLFFHWEKKAFFAFLSIFMCRIVQIILEQNHTNEVPLHPKIIKVYSPYWLGIARCPPLSFRLVDASARRLKKNPLSFQTKRIKEVILEEITEEEIHEGYTIASALNFKSLGLSASIGQSGGEHFGPAKDLSPLGDMVKSMTFFCSLVCVGVYLILVSRFIGWLLGCFCL